MDNGLEISLKHMALLQKLKYARKGKDPEGQTEINYIVDQSFLM